MRLDIAFLSALLLATFLKSEKWENWTWFFLGFMTELRNFFQFWWKKFLKALRNVYIFIIYTLSWIFSIVFIMTKAKICRLVGRVGSLRSQKKDWMNTRWRLTLTSHVDQRFGQKKSHVDHCFKKNSDLRGFFFLAETLIYVARESQTSTCVHPILFSRAKRAHPSH